MGNFQNLKVWQRAKDLAVYIYQITNDGIFSKDYGLRDQIRRAAVSIPSNLAEGDELGTNKQAINFFHIAKGSTAEVQTQAIVAREIAYIDENTYDHITEECSAISAMITRLIQARNKSPNRKPQTANHEPQTMNPKPRT
jgi:four helix bundle protein